MMVTRPGMGTPVTESYPVRQTLLSRLLRLSAGRFVKNQVPVSEYSPMIDQAVSAELFCTIKKAYWSGSLERNLGVGELTMIGFKASRTYPTVWPTANGWQSWESPKTLEV